MVWTGHLNQCKNKAHFSYCFNQNYMRPIKTNLYSINFKGSHTYKTRDNYIIKVIDSFILIFQPYQSISTNSIHLKHVVF